jgi:GNAT superfamily N-acetyltransferase
MAAILKDLSTPSLISAIEGNLFELNAAYRKWPRAEVYDEAEILWSLTDIPFPHFNNIMRAKIGPERIEAVIEKILAQAVVRNIPLLWWTGPTTRPADLGRHLERHGFVNEGQVPGMAVDLANLNEDVPMPAGLRLERATDNDTLKLCCQVCTAGFGLPDFVTEAFYEFVGYVDPEMNLAYLAWLNDEPVATAYLMLAAGVAGIYHVATLPAARRQGIGAVVTLAALREARHRKYKVGILQASQMGLEVYRSLGFQEYCKIGQYIWMPTPKQAEA